MPMGNYINCIINRPVKIHLGAAGDICTCVVCRFWLAVQELKKRPIREVPSRVQEIWQEFLAPGAANAINVDSKSYDKTTQNVKDPGRYTFEDAQVRLIVYRFTLIVIL